VGELIISPEDLADIRAQCLRRAAELRDEPARSAAVQSVAPPASATPVPPQAVLSGSEQEALRFAAAIDQMPPRVRAFFERDDPIPPWRWESAEDRAERSLANRSAAGAADLSRYSRVRRLNPLMHWHLSHRADPLVKPLA
jgi:hypothetical protein